MTTYQPFNGMWGYNDFQLQGKNWKVSFYGKSNTFRDDVEIYYLRRAAEVVLDQDYTHFTTKHTTLEEAKTGGGSCQTDAVTGDVSCGRVYTTHTPYIDGKIIMLTAKEAADIKGQIVYDATELLNRLAETWEWEVPITFPTES